MDISPRDEPTLLPVAETGPVTDRLLRMVQAVRPQDVDEVRALTERLLAEDAPALRDLLLARKQAEDAAGWNWMARPWRQGYFAQRRPLALSTNVLFQLALGRDQPGGAVAGPFGRAADVIRRVAAVHLAEVRGETAPPVDARGTVLDASQLACLAGGLRHPDAPQDYFMPAAEETRGREMGLIVAGRFFAVPLTGDDGRLLGRAALASAVARVVERVRDGADREGDDEVPFTAVSALGSGRLAGLLPQLLRNPVNAQTYARLRDLLFTFTLMPGDAQETAAGDTAAVLQGLTDPSLAWVYRPVSYLHRLADGWTAAQVEHSTVDGASIVEAVRRMQERPDAQEQPGQDEADAAAGRAGGDVVVAEQLRWHWTPQLHRQVWQELAEVAALAAGLRVDVVRTLRPDTRAAGMKVSLDAVQQLVMALAQRLAFGRVRAHYESVDMREHQAGRTECLRPVTPELVELVEALAGAEGTGEADGSDGGRVGQGGAVQGGCGPQRWRELLVAAVDAHREWVKTCKAGGGVDRHLFGLGLAAEQAPERVAVLAELAGHPAVQAAREDFLSTTSIGSADQVVRYAFAPTVEDGFGVAYTPGAQWLEFTVTSWAGRAQTRRFLEALPEAAERVEALLRTVGEVG